MKVFRIQDKDGRGPFKPGFSTKWVEDRPDHINLKPWMIDFNGLPKGAIDGMVMGVACKTIEQLKRWFTQTEYSTLLNYGYRAVIIDATVLVESNTQCFIQRAEPFNESVEFIELYGDLA